MGTLEGSCIRTTRCCSPESTRTCQRIRMWQFVECGMSRLVKPRHAISCCTSSGNCWWNSFWHRTFPWPEQEDSHECLKKACQVCCGLLKCLTEDRCGSGTTKHKQYAARSAPRGIRYAPGRRWRFRFIPVPRKPWHVRRAKVQSMAGLVHPVPGTSSGRHTMQPGNERPDPSLRHKDTLRHRIIPQRVDSELCQVPGCTCCTVAYAWMEQVDPACVDHHRAWHVARPRVSGAAQPFHATGPQLRSHVGNGPLKRRGFGPLSEPVHDVRLAAVVKTQLL